MILVVVTFIISLILDGILSMIIPSNSILLPLFTIVSLVIIYPSFKKNPLSYFIYLAIFGAAYDLLFGDIYLLNVILFCITGFIIQLLNYLPNNYLMLIVKLVLVICLYRAISYVAYLVLTFNFINLGVFFKGIFTSLILNIIYGILLYFIVDKIKNRKISKHI